jgi:ABC-2 type transport system permease protein
MMSRFYFIAFTTLLRKEIKRFLRIWVQTLLPSLVTTLLYFLIFGQVVGKNIAPIAGYNYIAYISPGLIMMAIITNTFTNVSSSLYSMRFQRSIEEILISPIPDALLLAGFVLGGMVRGLLIGILVTLLSLYFTPLPVPHIWTLMLIIPSTALLFALAGFTNAIFANSFDHISAIPTFVLTPLTYLGGIFYSISALPVFWQKVSLFNPFVYIVNAFRYALLGVTDVSIGLALGVIWMCCGALLLFNLYLLTVKKKLRG